VIRLVISATNLVEGGGLQVLRDCVDAAARLSDTVETTVIVHDRALLSDRQDVAIIEMPKVKGSWFRRIYNEYVGFRGFSKNLKADVWLSLHDMTPNVISARQYVYFHNPSPFFKMNVRQMINSPSFAIFNAFYGFLYRANIHRNKAVIVQQNWFGRECARRYGAREIIVAAPKAFDDVDAKVSAGPARVFLYPAFPRVFKNFEVICQAVRELERDPDWAGEVRFTISGTENRYARWIARLAQDVPSVRLVGRQDAAGMRRHYGEADVVLFPSKLETWGLPITEAKAYGKALLLADLPYAHESLGHYDGARFVAPDSAGAWAQAMRDAAIGRYGFTPIDGDALGKLDFAGWDALLAHLVKAA